MKENRATYKIASFVLYFNKSVGRIEIELRPMSLFKKANLERFTSEKATNRYSRLRNVEKAFGGMKVILLYFIKLGK